MKYKLFKPTAKNTGSAFTFSCDGASKSFFINAIKQGSWDAKKRVGSFKENSGSENRGTGNIAVKFNVGEAGAFVKAFREQRSLDFTPFEKGLIHDWDGEKTLIHVNHSERGHLLNIKKNDASFSIGITPAEAVVLETILTQFIVDVAKQEQIEDDANAEKYKNNNSGGSKSRAQKSKPEPEPEPEEEEQVDDDVPF